MADRRSKGEAPADYPGCCCDEIRLLCDRQASDNACQSENEGHGEAGCVVSREKERSPLAVLFDAIAGLREEG